MVSYGWNRCGDVMTKSKIIFYDKNPSNHLIAEIERKGNIVILYKSFIKLFKNRHTNKDITLYILDESIFKDYGNKSNKIVTECSNKIPILFLTKSIYAPRCITKYTWNIRTCYSTAKPFLFLTNEFIIRMNNAINSKKDICNAERHDTRE